MKARDVMVTNVITVSPELDVKTVARLMVANGISAVPVTDESFNVIGIVSEGDLLHRPEIKTERKQPWWLEMLMSDQGSAIDFVKSHARQAKDVMARNVITADAETSLQEIAGVLEKNGIKRVPILEQGKLVGIVSRANIIQAFASLSDTMELHANDEQLRRKILDDLSRQPWGKRPVNVLVKGGVAELWGVVPNADEKDAIRVAVESTAGIVAVRDNLRILRLESMG